MLLVLDLGEVARDLEQHPLMWRRRARLLLAKSFIEIGDRGVEHARDLEEPPSRHPVDAALVLVRLLIGYPDKFRELLLGEPEHDATLANTGADMVIDRRG